MPQSGIENLNQIGRILKSNGSDGEVLAEFDDIDVEDLDSMEPVYIVFDGVPVPFFIDSISQKGQSRAVLRLVDVDSAADAEEMAGRELLSDAFSFEDDDDEFSLDLLVGLRLFSVPDGEEPVLVGKVSDYENIPGNPCLYVRALSGEEKIVPFHEDLVRELDLSSGTLVMTIPEGLI